MTRESAISAVAALDEPLRRRMYAFIRQARRPVTRDEAAASAGISRKLAAFHLDKLVAAGLLRAHFQATGVRKVGRTPKVYEPVHDDIQVAIPPREHAMLAEVLIDAVLTERPDETAREASLRVARQHGADAGAAERARAKPGRLGAERALTLAEALLAGYGFEPSRESPTCVRLRNCPFHPLTARSGDLVCGINHAFLGGLLDGLRAQRVDAVLEPRSGECCVELRAGGPPGRD